MSVAPRPSRRPPAPRRRSTPLRILGLLLAALLVFVLGVGVGQALRDGPAPPRDVTTERTLDPSELPPVPTGG